MQGDTRYRLGNQDKEWELRTDYLNWTPEGCPNWDKWCTEDMFGLSSDEPRELVITNPNSNQKVTLLMDHALIKSAFPLSFLIEERAKDWYRFYKVALKEHPDEQFIIPLH